MRYNEKGFTIVEIMVVVAIMALLLIPISSLMITNSRGIITANETSDLQEKALQIMSAFRTHCLYTSRVDDDGLYINGVSSQYRQFEINEAAGISESTDGASFKLTILKPTDSGYIKTVYSYDKDSEKFTITDNGKQMLEVSDVKVSIQPIGKKGSTSFTFNEASGITVKVALARDITRVKRKLELKELQNAFYFRNSNVDINDLMRTPSPDSTLAMPDPDTGGSVATPPADEESGGSGGTGGSGGSGESGGESGGTGGSGESGGESGGTGGSGESGGESGGTGGSSESGGGDHEIEYIPPSTPDPTPVVTPDPTPIPESDSVRVVLDNYSYSILNPDDSVVSSNNWLTIHLYSNISFGNCNIERFADNSVKTLDIYVYPSSTLKTDASTELNFEVYSWNIWQPGSVVRVHNMITGHSDVKVNLRNESPNVQVILVENNGTEMEVFQGSAYTSLGD